ncbi:MAG: ABC transporter ATP-binding protein [Eubacterium sp.]|nr:ABC transporter ATP-binding protein [Eubacterium sp.]
MEQMITVTDITSSYGKKQILKGASFTAMRGECIAVVGANGCGKSTLLSVLAGTLKPGSGEVLYYGRKAWSDSDGGRMRADMEVIRGMTGYVPQENPLIPELTVYDNLRLWYPDKRKLAQELERGFLNLLGINGFVKKQVSKLSGGMKKRVSIGIAMAGMPPVLLLDEPSAALDLVCKEDIRRYLQAYLSRKGTVVITTHEESELDLCNKVYVMKNGRLDQVDHRLRGEALVRLF